ncbi:site-specific integrase [Candidatus Woesearchaeota archaeon]|nr:site-specific integrase [Candidatus Woesearchaeota archaeon]
MAPTKKQASESYARTEQPNQTSLLSRISESISKNIRDQLIFTLLLETGCSSQELTEMKPKDIEFTTNSISIGQGAQRRTVKISKTLSLQLKYFTDKKKERLFSTRQSKGLTARRVMQLAKQHTKAFMRRELSTREIRKIYLGAKTTEASKEGGAEELKREAGLRSLRTKESLSQEQVRLIRGRIEDEQHKLIFDTILETGCRLSELVNIKAKDLDVKKDSIRIGKHTSKISQRLSLQLTGLTGKKQPNKFLFSTRQSPQISDKRVFQLVRDYAKKAGIQGVSPQILRNTSIAQAMEEGKDAKEIEQQTGIKHLDLHHYGISIRMKDGGEGRR